MSAKNDVTGDKIRTKAPSREYRENWDKIFSREHQESMKELEDKTPR